MIAGLVAIAGSIVLLRFGLQTRHHYLAPLAIPVLWYGLLKIFVPHFFSGSFDAWFAPGAETLDSMVAMTHGALNVLIIILGSMIGSFLNVCMLRLPEGRSVITPRSRCPKCQRGIAWYDNIPVVSWILLRGRCRHCRKAIALQYPLVEAWSGFMAWALFQKYGASPAAVIYFAFVSAMLVIAIIDLTHRIIPNVISLPGILLGLGASFVLPEVTWWEAFLGALLGGGVLLAVAEGYRWLRKVDGMGMGDVKLLGMIGAFLGLRSLLFVILVSSATGAVIGSLFILVKGKDWRYQIPFGTFLAAAAVLYVFYGPQWIAKWPFLFPSSNH